MDLDYKVYKNMTAQQKEEWNYKFSKKVNILISFGEVILLYTFNVLMLVSAHFLLTYKGIESVYSEVLKILHSSASFTTIYIILLCILQIVNIVSFCINDYTAKKWLESEGINYKKDKFNIRRWFNNGFKRLD